MVGGDGGSGGGVAGGGGGLGMVVVLLSGRTNGYIDVPGEAGIYRLA